MRLAFAELRRSRARYLSIVAAIGFIVFLVLILAGLADGLYYGATGAYRSGGADLYSFDEDAQRSIVRSDLAADTVDEVRSVPGVSDAGPIGIQLGSTEIDGEVVDVALMGVEPGRPGAPVNLDVYEATTNFPIAVADSSLENRGLAIGDVVLLTGATTSLEIVGFVDDSSFLLAGTLWTTTDAWRSVRTEIVPEFGFLGDAIQAIAVSVEDGSDPASVALQIDTATGTTETVTTEAAISSLPGVEQQAATFQAIIIASFLVVGIVTALFFALITLEKRGLFAVLKAIGATNWSLLQGLIVQGLIAAVGGFIVGLALSRIIGLVIPAEVPLTFLAGTAFSLLLATIFMGAVGAGLSFRRVSKIDPATALGGGV
ncbi:MAG: ABC transporter permease [Acidimicrobiia bacterium]